MSNAYEEYLRAYALVMGDGLIGKNLDIRDYEGRAMLAVALGAADAKRCLARPEHMAGPKSAMEFEVAVAKMLGGAAEVKA